MPFRPLTPEERRLTELNLSEAVRRVILLQGYIKDLRLRLKEGMWFPREEEE